MLGSHRLGAITEVRHYTTRQSCSRVVRCARMVHWAAVLLKLKLLPHLWLYKEREIHGTWVIGIYQSICVPKTVVIDEVLTKLLQK